MPTPLDVVHDRARNVVTIQWADDVTSTYRAPYLRSWCPCAGCQGHQRGVRRQREAPGVEIEGMFEMGSYAVAVRFSDGHDTGIYTWEWLRALAQDGPPAGEKSGTYLDGKFVS